MNRTDVVCPGLSTNRRGFRGKGTGNRMTTKTILRSIQMVSDWFVYQPSMEIMSC